MMSVVSLVVVGSALVVGQAAGAPAERSRCAATAMIAEARADVAVSGETLQLQERLARASAEADAAEKANSRRERRKHCVDALLAYADLAAEVHGHERGEREATRARQLAVELSLGSNSYIGPRVPPPVPTPEQQWERRRRRLIAHTAASGVFTLVGVALLTVPWIATAVACRNSTDTFTCGAEGYGAITISGIGAPIFVASAIPLGIWSTRLYAHLQTRPAAVAMLNGRARLQFTGPGLRLDF